MEKPKTGQPPLRGQQESYESVDAVLEHMLQEGKELGSGEDGIVLKVDLAILTQNERHLLAESKVITHDEEVNAMAVKILKIYNPGLGDHEFRMQKRAREILFTEKNVARIPNITTARDQHINTETKDRFNRRGAHLEDRAEIIMMDCISGQDFGTIMYSFALGRMGYEEDYITDLSYSQKEQMVGQELGFERPNLESAQTSEENASAHAITFDRNEEKLFKYLKKQGFQIDPTIFEKVDNGVRILNQNGLYHNDLHKQNIMMDTDGEVYIIDFGRAGNEKRKDGIADTLFSKRWRRLSLREEDEQKGVHMRERAQIERNKEKLQSHPVQKERVNSFIRNVTEKGIQALEREFALSRGDDTKFEQFLIMLHIARESKGINSEMIDAFIVSLEDKGLRPFERNKIQKLRRLF